MATVRQSGGDYGSLNAALAAAETTIDIDQAWTVDDTTKATISTTGTTITVSGPAKHSGKWDTAANHYRLVCTGGHCITLNGAYTATINGIAVNQNGTGESDECFRCVPGTAHTVTIRRSLFRCANNANQQDCIYTGFNTSIGTITVEQCVIQGANRGGIHSQNGYSATGNGTINVNSSTIWNNGRGGSDSDGVRGGGIYCGRTIGNRTGIIINVQNSAVLSNTSGNAGASDFEQDNTTNPPVWNISNSISSDVSISPLIAAGSNNLQSRTATDNASPGAGNWVVFNDITTSPFDLRLKSSAENDAQDAHATATAHGLTIPSTDIVGTSRPQNTNYDIGAFEILASGGVSVTPTGVSSASNIGILTAKGAAVVGITGLVSTAQLGNIAVLGAANISLTGLSALGQAGDPSIVTGALAALAGQSSAGILGALDVKGGAQFAINGNVATGQTGVLSVIGAALATLTGNASATALGSVTVVTAGGVSVTLAGVFANTQTGTLVAKGGAQFALSGTQSTGQPGALGATGAASIQLSGLLSTTQAGALSATGGAVVTLPGVFGQSALGGLTVVVQGGVSVSLAGVQSSANIGAILAKGGASVPLSGLVATGETGTLTIQAGGITVALAGVTSTGQIGNISVKGGAVVPITGVLSNGQIGTVLALIDSGGSVVGKIELSGVLDFNIDLSGSVQSVDLSGSIQ